MLFNIYLSLYSILGIYLSFFCVCGYEITFTIYLFFVNTSKDIFSSILKNNYQHIYTIISNTDNYLFLKLNIVHKTILQ